MFIRENQITIKIKSVTINIKQFRFTTNAHTLHQMISCFHFCELLVHIPQALLSFRYGFYFQEMYTASCMVGSSALI